MLAVGVTDGFPPRSATRHGASAVLVAALVGATLSGPARADEAADTATARALGVAGVALAEAGNCSLAIEKLARAEALHHAPSTAERLGECEIEVGKIVAGTERLQRVIREPLAPNAPPPFVAAVARARTVLDKAMPRIAMLRVDVKAPADAHVAIAIDGEPIPDAVVRDERPTDPGRHEVRATAPGYVPASASVFLADGESKTFSLQLSPVASAGPTSSRTPYLVQDSSSSGSHSYAAAITAFAVGGVGLAVGAIAGAEVMSKSSTLSSNCNAGGECPANMQADISSAKTWALISTTSFAIGGTGLLAGIMLLLTQGGSPTPEPKAATVLPVVGGTSAGLRGWF